MDVKKIRKSAGLTQAQFWERIGITQSGGSRYEMAGYFPEPIGILLTIAYGNLREARRTVDALRK